MHHYPFHPSDYMMSTAHLSVEEDIIYRRLLDLYYTSEQPIPLETQSVSRRLRVGTERLELVLQEFFLREDDGFHNARCDAELAQYRAMRDRNAKNGKKGGRPASRDQMPNKSDRKPKTNPVGCHWEPTGKPTKNQEPRTKNQGNEYTPPSDLDQELWAEFVAHRKSKKARITPLAMSGILSEAEKAGYTLAEAVRKIIQRNWTGFEAEWVRDKFAKPASVNGMSPAGNRAIVSASAWLAESAIGNEKEVQSL